MPVQLESPYLSRNFSWLRGNLHAHTTLSDGASPPEEVLADYEKSGYDFMALSDHDLLVPTEKYQPCTKMTLIPADEVTARGPHILAVHLKRIVPPTTDRQKVIDRANAQGGFTVINHPNWQDHFNHCPHRLMEKWTGYTGIEIYNGVIERLTGSALALDRWDRLLGSGRRVWGFAHDDSHCTTDIARGWNVVQATDRSIEAICDALKNGRFYASTGVEISRIAVEGDTISVTAPNAQRIRLIGTLGKELDYKDASQATFQVTTDAGRYVRVECFGEGARCAWTQPCFLT